MRLGGRGQEYVEDPAKTMQNCLNASVIVAATVTDFKPGMSTRSMPPQCHYSLTLADMQALRGTLPHGELKIIITGNAQPVKDQEIVLFGSYQGEHFAFEGQIADEVASLKKKIADEKK